MRFVHDAHSVLQSRSRAEAPPEDAGRVTGAPNGDGDGARVEDDSGATAAARVDKDDAFSATARRASSSSTLGVVVRAMEMDRPSEPTGSYALGTTAMDGSALRGRRRRRRLSRRRRLCGGPSASRTLGVVYNRRFKAIYLKHRKHKMFN